MDRDNQDKIEISEDDLATADTEDRLVITPDDLLDVPDEPDRAFPPVQPAAYGGQLPSGVGTAYTAKPASGAFAASTLVQGLIAGAIGGFLAWAATEPLFNEARDTYHSLFVDMGLFGGLIGALIGLALGAAEGVMSRAAEKALTGAAIGMGVGFAGGFFGGMVGQAVYSGLGGGIGESGMGQQVLARAIGWGVVGTFVGLGQGIAMRSSRKIVNALIGGLIGGTVGGAMFDLIGLAVGGGAASRVFAITALGACAGAAIGLVEELRKQAWLSVIQGWLTGKQFIIYKDVTTIGSSPKCDISIFKDPSVAPQHAVIRVQGGRYSIHCAENSPVLVNQQPVSNKVLRNGDTIGIGGTVFLYSEKATEFSPRGA